MIGSFAIDLDHRFGDDVFRRHADEYVGIDHGLLQRVNIRLANELLLVLVPLGVATFVHDALGIDHQDVFQFYAERQIQLGASDTCGAGAGKHDADLADIFAAQLERV